MRDPNRGGLLYLGLATSRERVTNVLCWPETGEGEGLE